MNIIYEDNHIIVVEKPVNVPVQGDISGDLDMLTALKRYIKNKYNKPGDVYLCLVHRLDRPVGGVMVFARTSKAAARLSAQFASKAAEKRYAAIVEGESLPEAFLEDYIARDEATYSSYISHEGDKTAKKARLWYGRAGRKNGLTLLDVNLENERHHQIRVQLAAQDMPILGDRRYNHNSRIGQQIALWAYSLSIEHPTQKIPMRFISMPKGDVWEQFSDELTAMVNDVRIAYIDEDIIIADKPYGIVVAAADSDGESLEMRLVTAFLEAYPIHRIDATTVGLVLFARNERAKRLLDNLMRERRIHKYYHCTVKGVPAIRSAALHAWCVKDESTGFVKVLDEQKNGAKEMITLYEVKSECGDTSDLEVELITGRTHQIRAHLAHIGYPIVGDDKYGDREFNKKVGIRKVQLISQRIMFEFNGRIIDVSR